MPRRAMPDIPTGTTRLVVQHRPGIPALLVLVAHAPMCDRQQPSLDFPSVRSSTSFAGYALRAAINTTWRPGLVRGAER
jgi:hypothetical protein